MNLSKIAFAAVFGIAIQARTVWGSTEISHLTLGRLTHYKGQVMIHNNYKYKAQDQGNPSRDTAVFSSDLEYAINDRLTIGTGFATEPGPRGLFKTDRLTFEAAYMLPVKRMQIVPMVELAPSLRGQPANWEIKVLALKNIGRMGFLFSSSVEGERLKGDLDIESEFETGLFYRFGLHGMLGMEWKYKSRGAHALGIGLGGSISKNIFLGLEPQIGLTPGSPDLSMRFQLHFLFGGAYTFGDWGLE